MNYILQLNGFWRWRKTNSVTSGQADLFYAILECGNSTGWKQQQFNIPNSTLMGMCEISKPELHKRRLALIQKGLIQYTKGKKGTAGIYYIGFLYETNMGTNMGTNMDTNLGTNMEDIPKQNKIKQNNKDSSAEKPKTEELPIDHIPDKVPYSKIKDLFNSICGDCYAKVTGINGKRQESVSARFGEYGLDGFEKAFQEMANSDFLKGENKNNWKATFDWLIKPSNFQKVVEGNYQNKQPKSNVNSPPPSYNLDKMDELITQGSVWD